MLVEVTLFVFRVIRLYPEQKAGVGWGPGNWDRAKKKKKGVKICFCAPISQKQALHKYTYSVSRCWQPRICAVQLGEMNHGSDLSCIKTNSVVKLAALDVRNFASEARCDPII